MGFQGLLFLSSGLYMGWSLGANTAASIFATAVGTRMVRFRTAAVISIIFITLGSVISGAGAADTLGELGAVNALPGAFIVALSAAVTVTVMARAGLPISTTQSIVGSLIGWNLYAGYNTDQDTLTTIVGSWVYGPVLGAVFAFVLYFAIRFIVNRLRIHLIRLDKYTRCALILAGAFGCYSLGANNMASVVGAFVQTAPFVDIRIMGITLSGTQQLFLCGGLAAGVGFATYSRPVISTVGTSVLKLSPITAFIVIAATATVLFLFASEGLEAWLQGMGLPSFPLVPVSLSQVSVGSIIGIGLAKGGKNLDLRLLRNIVLGWMAAPTAAALMTYISLFVMQNVFMQPVYV